MARTAAVLLVSAIGLAVWRGEWLSGSPRTNSQVVVDTLNGGRGLFENASPDGRQSVSEAVGLLREFSPSGWDLAGTSIGSEHGVAIPVKSRGFRYLIVLRFPGERHNVSTIEAMAIVPLGTGAQNIEIDATVSGLDDCIPRKTNGHIDQLVPLSSVSKLVVVVAVARAIDGGEFAPDTVLEVSDRLRSLPSGTWQGLPIGATRTVEEALIALFVGSDNTAADLLIDRVGREAVESVGHEHLGMDPEYPFLLTSEVFKLRWAVSKEVASAFDSDPAGRLSLLAGTVASTPLPEPAALSSLSSSEAEWFGTIQGLCGLWSELLGSEMWASTALSGLALWPLEADAMGAEPVIHKGGRGPRVSAFTGVVIDACGELVVVSIVAHGPTTEPWNAAGAAYDLFGQELSVCA